MKLRFAGIFYIPYLRILRLWALYVQGILLVFDAQSYLFLKMEKL